MSDQANGPDTYSPDALETQYKGSGVRRLNWLPLWIVGTLLIAALMSFVYTGELRSSLKLAQAESADQDKYRVSGVVPPPIVRPDGPDVYSPPPVAAARFSPEGKMVEPMMESEVEKRAREDKMAAHKAALSAKSEVAKRTETAISPPPPGNPVAPPGIQPPSGSHAGDINQQADNRPFLNTSDQSSPYLNHSVIPASSPYQIMPGTIIPATMVGGINSDLPGCEVTGKVREDVYDSATGQHLLIPMGTTVKGVCDSNVAAGQERILTAWNQIVFSDSSFIMLDGMPGTDQGGYGGFKEKVNSHYWRTFGQAALLSLFTAASQLSQTRGSVHGTYSASEILAASVGMQGFNLGSQLIRRNLNIQNTLESSPGFKFNIAVTKIMTLLPRQRDSSVAAR